MPNGTIATGTPLENAIKGFDRPEDLVAVETDGRLVFFGYQDQVERYLEEHGRFIFDCRPLSELIVRHTSDAYFDYLEKFPKHIEYKPAAKTPCKPKGSRIIIFFRKLKPIDWVLIIEAAVLFGCYIFRKYDS